MESHEIRLSNEEVLATFTGHVPAIRSIVDVRKGKEKKRYIVMAVNTDIDASLSKGTMDSWAIVYVHPAQD